MEMNYADPEYKQWLLKYHGYDTNKFDIDDLGHLQPKIVTQPTVDPTPIVDPASLPIPTKTSVSGTLFHQAASSILPTGAGLGVGSLVASALAPETGGLSLIPLAISALAGAGAGAATSYGQSKLLPNAANQQLAQEQEEHPVASFIGGSLPSAVAFNPIQGARNIPRLLRSGGKAFSTGMATKGVDQELLKNALVNMGVSGGINTGQQLASDKPFSYGRLAADIGSAGLMNEPTAIGNLLGFKSTTKTSEVTRNPALPQEAPLDIPTEPIQNYGNQPISEAVNPLAPKTVTPINEADLSKAFPNPDKYAASETTVKPGQQEIDSEVDAQLKALNEKKVELVKAHQEVIDEGIKKANEERDALRQPPSNKLQFQDEPAPIEQPSSSIEPDDRAILSDKKTFLTALRQDEINRIDKNIREYNKKLDEGYKPTKVEQKLYRSWGERSNELFNQILGENRNITPNNKNGEFDDMYGNRYGHPDNPKYQDTPASNAPAESDDRAMFKFRNASPEYRRAVIDLAAKRGVSIREAVKLITPSGKEALGASDTSSRDVILTPKAELDTPYHEIVGHQFVDDLSKSPDAYDQKLAQSVKDSFSTHAKGAEEGAAIDQGVRGAQRVTTNLNGTPLEKARAWGNDFLSRWKFNLGLHSDEDVRNYLSQRGVTDAPYEGSKLDSNRSRYNGLVESYRKETNESKKLEIQKQIEALKNSENGGMKFQDEEELPKYQNEPALDHSTFGLTRSALDQIRLKDGPEAEPIVRGIENYYKTQPEIEGKYRNTFMEGLKGTTKEEQNKVEDVLLREREDNKLYRDTLTTPNEKRIYDTTRSVMKQIAEDRIVANQPVTGFTNEGKTFKRAAKVNPYYHPNRISPEVLDTFENHRNTPEADALKASFIKKQTDFGNTVPQAEKMFENLLSAHDSGASNKAHFRGLDIEQGAGLPRDWIRPGLEKNILGYIRRVSQARAYHDTIESKPEIAGKLGYTKDPWGKEIQTSSFHSPRVNEILHSIRGEEYSKEGSKIKTFNRIATALMLGPLTNIHIAASSIAKAISHFTPTEVPQAVYHMITDFHSGVKHAFENGSIQQNRKLFSDLLDAHSTGLEKMNSVAEGISRLNGRAATEYITKGLLQASGEYLVRSRSKIANTGDKSAIRIMKELDPNWKSDKEYNDKEISQLASNFAGLAHGKHDARTLPAGLLKETALQPFFSLASWSVGQTNHFFKHVITPAKEGNLTPLLMSTLGAGLGGYAIKELREKLSNKKSGIPSFQEIANSPRSIHNVPLVAYNLAAMASFAGYAGILSTGVKDLFDTVYKNAPQGASFPLDEIFTSSIHTADQAVSAIANASSVSEYVNIGTRAIADMLRENIQTARIASSWGDESGLLGSERNYKKNLNTEEGDLRRFKMASELPYEDQSTGGSDNPYFYANRKSFKHELDLRQAQKELPELIHSAMEESKIDGQLNMETFKSKLKALKGSTYASMPNPEEAPRAFYSYLKYLQATQGSAEASRRMSEYIRNNAIQHAKSGMVPSL